MDKRDFPAHLQDLLVDECYNAMQARFLMKGKGRRPDLKIPPLTHRVLLQLYLMMFVENESSCSAKMAEWFKYMYPDISYPSERIHRYVIRVFEKAISMGKDLLIDYLDNVVKFDMISDSLSQYGLTRQVLEEPHLFTGFFSSLKNAVVFDIEAFARKEGKHKIFTAEWIFRIFNMQQDSDIKCLKMIQSAVDRIVKEKVKLAKDRKRNPQKLALFSEREFLSSISHLSPALSNTIISSQLSVTAPCTAIPSSSSQSLGIISTIISPSEIPVTVTQYVNAVASCHSEVTALGTTISSSQSQLPVLSAPCAFSTASPVVSSSEIPFEAATSPQSTNPTSSQHFTSPFASTRSKQSGDLDQVKILTKEIKKLNLTIRSLQNSTLKAALDLTYSNTEIFTLKKENEKLQNKVKNLQRKQYDETSAGKKMESYRVQVHRLRKRCQQQESVIIRLNKDISQITQDLLYVESDIKLKENGKYTDDVRRVVWELQGHANVSASNCGTVIKTVSENLFHKLFNNYPSTQSCLNMADESQFIAYKQLNSVLTGTEFTLHLDGTSRDGKKCIGSQVSFKDCTNMSLGYQSVAKEDADTILDFAVGMLQEVIDSTEDQTEADNISKQIFNNICGLMTDRAATMKSFGSKFQDFLQAGGKATITKLLYCNAHFLLGLGSEVEKALRKVESSIENSPFGRDALAKFRGWSSRGEGAVARLIRTTCDILGPRGDEKSGCRSDWMAFCHEEGIESTIPSYRSNRFNCLFEASASIINHRQQILKFLKVYLGRINLKIESVMADLEDERLMCYLISVAILFLKLTDPYWTLINSKAGYHDFVKSVQDFNKCFLTCKENIDQLIDVHSNQPFKVTSKAVYISSISDALKTCRYDNVRKSLHAMVEGILNVTERQLGEFLEGGSLTRLLEEDTNSLDGLPLTNLLGEKAFGDLDFDFQKRRHCSLHHRSSIQMLRKNNISSWLIQQEDSSLLMKSARKGGRILREKHKAQEKAVIKAIRERQLLNEKEKKEKELKKVEMKEELIKRVHGHGGPCNDWKAVLNMKSRTTSTKKFVDALKDEVRYVKVVLGKDCAIKIGSSATELEHQLKEFLSPDWIKSPDLKQRKVQESSIEDDSDSSYHEESVEAAVFLFEQLDQWVAVYYDTKFYIGQVKNVLSTGLASVKFLEQCPARPSTFKWPRIEDIAEIESQFVFQWDIDIRTSGNGRLWTVPGVEDIQDAYDRLSSSL